MADVAHVVIQDEIDPSGAFYKSPDGRRTLVVSGKLGEMIMLDTPTETFHRVIGGDVQFRDGAAVLGDSLHLERVGKYGLRDGVPFFTLDSLAVRLVPKPPVAGELTQERLLQDNPEWGLEMRLYPPSGPALDALRAPRRPVEILAVFSTTCGHCRAQVPRLIKVVEAVGSPNLRVRYLASAGGAGEDSTMARYRVRYLPTFLVFREGKEIGGIVGQPRASVEEDLLAILRGLF